MTRILLGVVVAVIILAATGYFFLNQRNQTVNKQLAPISSTTQMPGVTGSPDSNLGAGGSSYLDSSGLFSLLYPNDWKQDSQNNGQVIRFYKQGATQTGQTEMYDGVILTFEKENLGGKPLGQWVDDRIKQATADGTSHITQPKKATIVNGYPGFVYTIRGLGEFETLVLQKDSSSENAVVITQLVADPQNVGYQKEVDSTLATLKLLK